MQEASSVSQFVPQEDDTSRTTITLRGHELTIETRYYPQAKLNFYVANPRIYTVVRQGGAEPTQDEILARMLKMEHVRELISDIRRNGGLIEPVIVKPETFEVLEGNSRLAAYRQLAIENPLKWSKIKCSFLPVGLDEQTIFALLGQYHIKGKKSWAPFEQAGFLYRRCKQHGVPIEQVGKEIGLKVGEARLYFDTFEFMLDHNDPDQSRFSYYYEFLKSRKIKKVRESYVAFDASIVNKIKSGEIEKAVDIRDELAKICGGPPNLVKRFATGQIDFEKACQILQDSGADNGVYKRLNRFRLWLAEDEVKSALSVGSIEEKRKIAFELEKIQSRAKILHTKADL